jgi:hypothetical protein
VLNHAGEPTQVEEAGAWSRSKNSSASFCDRPGCYDPVRCSCRTRARFCCDRDQTTFCIQSALILGSGRASSTERARHSRHPSHKFCRLAKRRQTWLDCRV